MTVAQQAAIFIEAFENNLLPRPTAIVRWADSLIIAAEPPTAWLIDLSTLSSPHIIDFISILEPQASSAMPLPLRQRLQIVPCAHRAGLLDLEVCLEKLFHVLFIDRGEVKLGVLEKRLMDALICWDCLEDLNKIPQTLRREFETLFQLCLTDTNEILELLDWKNESVCRHRDKRLNH